MIPALTYPIHFEISTAGVVLYILQCTVTKDMAYGEARLRKGPGHHGRGGMMM